MYETLGPNEQRLPKDPGDKYDSFKWDSKWDSPGSGLKQVYIDGYLYKVNNIESAKKLHKLRLNIDKLAARLVDKLDYLYKTESEEFVNGVLIFLDIHGTYERSKKDRIFLVPGFNSLITSKFLLSEIPYGDKTGFEGLCIPRYRAYIKGEFPVGLDKNMRATYRDIFLNLNMSKKELKDLIIHEISHTGCNHCTFIPDNHGFIFKKFEALLKSLSGDLFN